jgi:putative transposase
MPGRPVPIEVSDRQRQVLEALVRATSTSQQLAQRCQIVLMAADGALNMHIARELDVDRQRVRRWRRRWDCASGCLGEAEHEGASDKELRQLIESALSDELRSGARPKFSPEQIAAIISVGCEPPSDSGVDTSHWTPPELAAEVMKRGIVDSISPRQVDRFLARAASGRTRASTG